jgi:hypothetical protein
MLSWDAGAAEGEAPHVVSGVLRLARERDEAAGGQSQSTAPSRATSATVRPSPIAA